MLTKANW